MTVWLCDCVTTADSQQRQRHSGRDYDGRDHSDTWPLNGPNDPNGPKKKTFKISKTIKTVTAETTAIPDLLIVLMVLTVLKKDN